MRIIVVGVPGAGKTSIMEEVSKRVNYKIVNYGDVMLQMAIGKNLVEHRDEMRKLPIEIQRELQEEAAKKIGTMENVIVDTHLTIKTPSGYFPGLPKWILDEIHPDLIVIVEAEPQEIIRRRKNDTSRKRDYETYEEIEEHIMANRYAGFTCSILTGAPLMILQNRDGMLDLAVQKFMEAFK